MRDFNKLHVIALPRCATMSVCTALGMLGVRLAHLGKICGEPSEEHHDAGRLIRMHEQIQAGELQLDVLQECDGLADYPACIAEVFEALDAAYPGSLFINVRRDADPAGWLRSAEKQFVGLRILKTSQSATPEDRLFARVMNDFRRLTFGESEFEPNLFLRGYERHQRDVQRYFAGRADALLDIPDVGLLREHGFELLCGFLEVEPPGAQFPHSNKHSLAPQQAFMAARARGEITSQTGITVPDVPEEEPRPVG